MIRSFKHIAFLLVVIAAPCWAQKPSDIVIKVGSEEVSLAEFDRIFKKNNQVVNPSDRKSLDEYVQLFVNYKLKVVDAKEQGLDKKETFIKELEGYRKQLAQPYLIDQETEQKLQEEAYQRMRYEISANHILLTISENALPADTLTVYNKALKIRERIVKGEPFEQVALATSDDPSVKRNSGFLGYFSAFQMVYPFENAAYKTPVGQISMPVRTQFGYHLIKINDIRPSKGQVKVAHIMITVPQNGTTEQDTEAKKKAEDIRQQLLNNEDFAALAREFSQDPGTSKNGGEIPMFGSGRMVPEFEQAAFKLETIGQISEPVRTQFGWHIIKLLDRKQVGTLNEMLPEIKQKLSRDARALASRNSFIRTQKALRNFKLDSAALKSMVGLLDSNVYQGQWQPTEKMRDKNLFQYSGHNFTQYDLGTQIARVARPQKTLSLQQIAYKACSDLVDNSIIQIEEDRLSTDNPDFFYLMKEYYEGILLFEITDQNVWSKSNSNSSELEEFYKQHLDKYAWASRYHGLRISAPNEKNLKKAQKLVSSKKGANLSAEDLLKKFIVKNDTLISVQTVHCDPTSNEIAGYLGWNQSVSPIVNDNGKFVFHKFIKVATNEPRPLVEVRGQVIADFQDYLEAEWLKRLRQKYPVSIHTELLEKLDK